MVGPGLLFGITVVVVLADTADSPATTTGRR
jgi:hypothetical protein